MKQNLLFMQILNVSPEILVDVKCKINPENSATIKVSEYISSGFKSIENKHDLYRGKDCIKTFCKSLREHAMKIINFC